MSDEPPRGCHGARQRIGPLFSPRLREDPTSACSAINLCGGPWAERLRQHWAPVARIGRIVERLRPGEPDLEQSLLGELAAYTGAGSERPRCHRGRSEAQGTKPTQP